MTPITGTAVTCLLENSGLDGNRPATIALSNFNAVAANTIVKLTVSIINPPTTNIWTKASIVTGLYAATT